MIDSNAFLEFLRQRRFIRKFQDKIVSDKDIENILEADRWVPSASNKQPRGFIVIKNRDILKKISKTGSYSIPLKKAPLGIAIIGKIKENPDWYIQDTTLVSMNMMLMAWILNISICWIGNMDRKYAKTLLRLGENDFLLTILAVRYIKGKIQKPTLRKSLLEISRELK